MQDRVAFLICFKSGVCCLTHGRGRSLGLSQIADYEKKYGKDVAYIQRLPAAWPEAEPPATSTRMT